MQRILVVDDHADMRETLGDLLRWEGYSVAVAANGQEALQQLRHDPSPCLIILDLMMPIVDGVEFRRQQLQDPSIAAVPVVVMTGCDTPGPIPNGAAGYLLKPFDSKALLAVVESALHSKET